MAKKAVKNASKSAPKKSAAPARSASRPAEVRNSPVPKKVTGSPAAKGVVQKREVTREMISKRAHEIAHSGHGGSDLDNWLRAERELMGL
jgi:hypothetical protein